MVPMNNRAKFQWRSRSQRCFGQTAKAYMHAWRPLLADRDPGEGVDGLRRGCCGSPFRKRAPRGDAAWSPTPLMAPPQGQFSLRWLGQVHEATLLMRGRTDASYHLASRQRL